jgi:hypothetical protein
MLPETGNPAIMEAKLTFAPDPKTKASFATGTLYSISGKDGWVYFAQVAPDRTLGFLRYRAADDADELGALTHPVMFRTTVFFGSVGRALREGVWRKLGRHAPRPELLHPFTCVQWAVGTLNTTVWNGGKPTHDTRVDDPAIQDLEVMAVWDAVAHIPDRLVADFGAEAADWHVGGPVWRERRVKEEFARRFPEARQHQLPADWIRTGPISIHERQP